MRNELNNINGNIQKQAEIIIEKALKEKAEESKKEFKKDCKEIMTQAIYKRVLKEDNNGKIYIACDCLNNVIINKYDIITNEQSKMILKTITKKVTKWDEKKGYITIEEKKPKYDFDPVVIYDILKQSFNQIIKELNQDLKELNQAQTEEIKTRLKSKLKNIIEEYKNELKIDNIITFVLLDYDAKNEIVEELAANENEKRLFLSHYNNVIKELKQDYQSIIKSQEIEEKAAKKAKRKKSNLINTYFSYKFFSKLIK